MLIYMHLNVFVYFFDVFMSLAWPNEGECIAVDPPNRLLAEIGQV